MTKNQDYVQKREKLIPQAIREADAVGGDDADQWNRTFHTTMHRLAYGKGLLAYNPDKQPQMKLRRSERAA